MKVYSDERIKKLLDVSRKVFDWKTILALENLTYTDLGDQLVLPCPFHEDYSPSFRVSIKLGTYHCFSCQCKGSILYFLYERSGKQTSFRAFCENTLKINKELQEQCGFDTLKIETSALTSNFSDNRRFNRTKALTSNISLGELAKKVKRISDSWETLALTFTLLQEGVKTNDILQIIDQKPKEEVSLFSIIES